MNVSGSRPFRLMERERAGVRRMSKREKMRVSSRAEQLFKNNHERRDNKKILTLMKTET